MAKIPKKLNCIDREGVITEMTYVGQYASEVLMYKWANGKLFSFENKKILSGKPIPFVYLKKKYKNAGQPAVFKHIDKKYTSLAYNPSIDINVYKVTTFYVVNPKNFKKSFEIDVKSEDELDKYKKDGYVAFNSAKDAAKYMQDVIMSNPVFEKAKEILKVFSNLKDTWDNCKYSFDSGIFGTIDNIEEQLGYEFDDDDDFEYLKKQTIESYTEDIESDIKYLKEACSNLKGITMQLLNVMSIIENK
jgi:hypothetical protein